MALMTITEVAELFGVDDAGGNSLFDDTDIERYKDLAERVGG